MITFQFNKIPKPSFLKVTKIKNWLKLIVANENFNIKYLNYIFLNDEELLKINIKYLNHDNYTDIITFDNNDISTSPMPSGKLSLSKTRLPKIEGDVFISLERVEANAKKFNTTFENELHRVLAHGLLHLCGYKDKKKTDIEIMREKEEKSLALFNPKSSIALRR